MDTGYTGYVLLAAWCSAFVSMAMLLADYLYALTVRALQIGPRVTSKRLGQFMVRAWNQVRLHASTE